jgi:hypothetical protein
MMPTEPGREAPPMPGPIVVERPPHRWYRTMSAVIFVAACLIMGLFLLIFPWTDFWESNYFSLWIPSWHQYWNNMYIRGAVSGLGVVNLYISFLEMFRLRRFARH